METEIADGLYRALISVKGVLLHEGAAVLVKNQRGEWELPGGKLELGETFADCLRREFREELGLHVRLGPILAAAPHHVYPDIVVLIYGCHAEPFAALTHTDEHLAAGRFRLDELDDLNLPAAYHQAILTWTQDPRAAARNA